MNINVMRDWSSTKEYIWHLERMKNIKPYYSVGKNEKRGVVLQRLKTNNKKISLSIVGKKEQKNDGFLNKHHNLSINLPSLSQNQKQLLRKSISDRKIKNREATIILENYELGKRILNVKPMSTIKLSLLQKDYQKHEQYLKARNHTKDNILKKSQKRLQKFLEYSRYQKSISETLRNKALSHGNYVFTIRINDLKRVCKVEFNKNRLYNFIIKLGKNRFQFQHLSLTQIKKPLKFYFKKKHLKHCFLLFCQLQEIIQNDVKAIGQFIIDLSKAYIQMQGNKMNCQFMFQRKDERQGIQSKISQLLIGTISFDYMITSAKD